MPVNLNLVKYVHVWCVTLSFILFLTRLYWLEHPPGLLNSKTVKVLPHFIDTVLLSSGIIMAIGFGHSLSGLSWFNLKLTFVTIYIGLGIVSFKIARLRLPTAIFAILFFLVAAFLATSKPQLAI